MTNPIIPTTISTPVHIPALKMPLMASQLLNMADIQRSKKLNDINFKCFIIFGLYDGLLFFHPKWFGLYITLGFVQ